MKVELLVSRSGVDGAQNCGDIVDVSADEAKRMIEAGQALPARTQKVERATPKTKTEKAVK